MLRSHVQGLPLCTLSYQLKIGYMGTTMLLRTYYLCIANIVTCKYSLNHVVLHDLGYMCVHAPRVMCNYRLHRSVQRVCVAIMHVQRAQPLLDESICNQRHTLACAMLFGCGKVVRLIFASKPTRAKGAARGMWDEISISCLPKDLPDTVHNHLASVPWYTFFLFF